MEICMLKMATFVILSALLWISSAKAGSFSCKCKNGTECSVSCGCSGAISCGQDSCSSSCAACSQGGAQVAQSLGTALFRTAYIVKRGNYSSKDMIADFQAMFKEAAS